MTLSQYMRMRPRDPHFQISRPKNVGDALGFPMEASVGGHSWIRVKYLTPWLSAMES